MSRYTDVQNRPAESVSNHFSDVSMNDKQQAKQRLPAGRWIEYLLFWSVSYLFLARYFSSGESIGSIDLIYTLLFHVSLLLGVIINSFLLIPRLLAAGRYYLYIPLLLLLLEGCVRLNQFTFNVLADVFFPGYFFISYYERIDLYYFMTAYIGITSLLQFSRSWFREADTRHRLAEAEKDKSRQELKLLHSQIRPHFLFNSLNTIYALTRKKSPDAPGAVLRLSDLLRYTIRQTELPEVPLTDEIQYLQDFIALQKMRLNYPEMIDFTVQGDPARLMIAPMSLIVLVDNVFTHADLSPGKPATIRLVCDEHHIRFRCTNHIGTSAEHPSDIGERIGIGDGDGEDVIRRKEESENMNGNVKESKRANKRASESTSRNANGNGNGTGIANVRRQLELLYPGRHQLAITSAGEIYTAELTITQDPS